MGKQIAITGGGGFLGSHIVEYFVEQGEDVVVIDDFSSGDKKNLKGVINDIDVRKVNLEKDQSTKKALSDIDITIHLAAKIGGIGYFHDVPADIIAKNDAMTKNVFDAAVTEDLDRVVYASSSMVFERAAEFPVSEQQVAEIPPPASAYGFQKLAGEYYCRAYHDQYGIDYSIFRPFNAVGTREPPGDEVGTAHVIPDLAKKIKEEKQYPVTLLGSGTQVRSFTHVRDIASGVYQCAFRDAAKNEDFNLGSTEGVQIKELATKIWDLCGYEKPIEFTHKSGFEHDVEKRIPSSEKAKEQLDWEPTVPLDESLEEYLTWYDEEVME